MSTCKSGQSAEKKTKWPFFESMSFLDPFLEHAPTVSNLIEETSIEPVLVQSHSSSGVQSNDTLELTASSEPASLTQDTFKPPENTQVKPRGTYKRKSRESEFDLKVLQALQEPEKDEDLHGHLHFWKGLQPMLNQLDELEAMKFKHEVQGLLIQYVERSKQMTDSPLQSQSQYLSPVSRYPTIPSSGYSRDNNYSEYRLERVRSQPSPSPSNSSSQGEYEQYYSQVQNAYRSDV